MSEEPRFTISELQALAKVHWVEMARRCTGRLNAEMNGWQGARISTLPGAATAEQLAYFSTPHFAAVISLAQTGAIHEMFAMLQELSAHPMAPSENPDG